MERSRPTSHVLSTTSSELGHTPAPRAAGADPEAPETAWDVLARARTRLHEKAVLDDPLIALFVDRLRRQNGEAIVGIVFYGSCLSPATRKPTSFYDFFV